MGTSDFGQAGRTAARALYVKGLKDAKIDDPLEPAFAEAAVEEFSRLQRDETPGIYREAFEAADQAGKDLDIDEFHGVVEVLQNADDEGASRLRLALRPRGKEKVLLFAHDGGAIRLPDLVAMAIAFVSTKREDAHKKGRFGIGLKTLRRLGSTLDVHCGPYHASIAGNQLAPAAAAAPIKGFWNPARGETLLELRLDRDIDGRALGAWLEGFGADGLLFLDTVRTVTLAKPRSYDDAVRLSLKESAAEEFPLRLGRSELSCQKLRLSSPGGMTWDRYIVDRPVPSSAPNRSNKETGTHTPLGVAVPVAVEEPGRMFAGLPLGTSVGWPFSVNAQFDVDTPRKGVQRGEGAWNGWLLERAVEAIAAIARHRFETGPASGWAAVPLEGEVEDIDDDWLRGLLEEAVPKIQRRVFRGLKFEIGGQAVGVDDLAYEARELEKLLRPEDIANVSWGYVPLPRAFRDSAGRFRDVLEELGESIEVDVSRALALLDSGDGGLDAKSVGWFIKLAAVAIDAGCEDELLDVPSVVLRDGSRVHPPAPDAEGEVLVRQVRKASLAARLGLARPIHRSYLNTKAPDATRVRRWLERQGILAEASGDATTLRALDHRGRSGEEPLPVSADDLLDLRAALMGLDGEDREELGSGIGAAISVDGFAFKGPTKVKVKVPPADAYLPPSLEDRREDDGWTVAAAKTPGIRFVAASYKQEITQVRGARPLPAAAGFFRLLGCEIAPRLEAPDEETWYGSPASPIPDQLPDSQLELLGSRYVTHLQGNHLSSDLERVVDDIARDRSKKRRARRSRALLRTLNREWERLYEGHEQAAAVTTGGRWNFQASIPATWIAIAMDTPWLSSTSGEQTRPRGLVVRTPLNEAMFGKDYDGYADIDDDLFHAPAVEAIGVRTDPRASEIVHQLKEIRDDDAVPDEDIVASLYLALNAVVGDPEAAGDGLVGDLPAQQLRARFSEGAGLILTTDGWKRRTEVYRGKAIFGRRRPVVPHSASAESLWRVLGVTAPDIKESVAVLKEIAKRPPTPEDEPTLASIYAHLASLAPSAKASDRKLLADLPVWTGRGWTRARPVYAVDDERVADALSRDLKIWYPPVTPGSLAGLLDAIAVEHFDDRSFRALVTDDDLLRGETERTTFSEAVVQLRGELAIHNQALHDALSVPWEDLVEADVAISPTLRLELAVPGERELKVPAHAHLSRKPLRLSCSNAERLGARDAGRSIAGLFGDADQHLVELAWVSAWGAAKAGAGRRRMFLAEEAGSDSEVEAVFRRAGDAVGKRPDRERIKERAAPRKRTELPARERDVRRLKSPDDLVISSVEMPRGGPDAKRRGSRGLKKDLPDGKPIKAKPPSLGAVKAYDGKQKEHLGLVALKQAIGDGLEELRDFSHLRGVGADALKGEAFFELKAHEREMPNHVELTPNEYRRALESKRKFYLVVVAGLEEGFETVLRLIPDPANVLEASGTTGIELRGIRSVSKPIEVRFGTNG